jgi:hypothetical protein
MALFKKNPLFGAALTVCGLVVVGEGWCIYERWSASRAADAKLTQKLGELQAMSGLTPPPTRDVATAIEADLARAQRAVAMMRGELSGHGPAAERVKAAKPPAATNNGRTEEYFNLATFVEKTRDLAKKQDIDVRPEASRFGFATYANAGPEADRIEPVFHQQLIAQYLIESLCEAKPRALVSVQREKTLTEAERKARADALAANNGQPPDANSAPLPGSNEPDGPDFFEINSRMSARVPGYVDTTAFRLVFTGQTAALRSFLNKLASFELPVLVREVEVEPTAAEETPTPSDDTAPAASSAASVVLSATAASPKPVTVKPPTAAPIVAKPLSKFTVTVEHIELVATPGETAEAAAQGGATKPGQD